MGNSESYNIEPRSPPRQIAVFHKMFANHRGLVLRLRENVFSLSGDDFMIMEANTNQPWFQVKGKAFSFRDKKALLDVQGNMVWKMQDKLMSFMSMCSVSGPDGNKMFSFRQKMTCFSGKFVGENIRTQDGQCINLECCCDWRGKHGIITLGPSENGYAIARIFRQSNAKHYFCGQQDYFLQIAAGVDAALMIAVCTGMDEMMTE